MKRVILMDIFEYADSINWSADYYDMYTGYIYAITRASESHDCIPVYDNGVLIGTVSR